MEDKMIELLKAEVVPALGCTEPIAVAYAAAKASEILGVEPSHIKIILSGNVLKNGMSVGIPGTGMVGLGIAASLGAVGGNARKVLKVLEDISEQAVVKAKKKLENHFVDISLAEVPNKLYIEAIAEYGKDYAKVIIKDYHSMITLIEKNNTIIYKANCDDGLNSSSQSMSQNDLSIKRIYEFATTVDLSKIEFMEETIQVNEAIAIEGLENDYGLKVGKTRLKYMHNGILSDDLENYAIAMTSAAADARMAGSTMLVMSNSGSGNQGITATVPIISVARKLSSSREQLLRAITLSSLTVIYIKGYLGRLSALCGCVIAGTGSSCGICYLLGGSSQEIEACIQNMLGNISGMFCDGAKPGCALKIATGVSAAIQSALLAKENIVIHGVEGVVDNCVEKTILNVCDIGREAMTEIDKMILDIMLKKQK